jgi:hypothetical protein
MPSGLMLQNVLEDQYGSKEGVKSRGVVYGS